MALKEFSKIPASPNSRENKGFQVEITLTAGQTSDWYQIPPGGNIIGVLIAPVGAGTGKCQVTNDTFTKCMANTAFAEDWPQGSVSASTTDAVYPTIFAIRASCSSGTIRAIFTLN